MPKWHILGKLALNSFSAASETGKKLNNLEANLIFFLCVIPLFPKIDSSFERRDGGKRG